MGVPSTDVDALLALCEQVVQHGGASGDVQKVDVAQLVHDFLHQAELVGVDGHIEQCAALVEELDVRASIDEAPSDVDQEVHALAALLVELEVLELEQHLVEQRHGALLAAHHPHLQRAGLDGKDDTISLIALGLENTPGFANRDVLHLLELLHDWLEAIDEEDLVFSSLLKIFAAKIKFKKIEVTGYSPKYSVIASIQLGVLTMEFSGSGYLKGEQPLLTYFLNLIELKAGSKLLLKRSLKEQSDKEKTFFSLIALEKNDQWLSARGQGGAVVIWLKD